MTSNRAGKCFAYAVVAALALGTVAAYATDGSGRNAATVPVVGTETVTVALAGDIPTSEVAVRGVIPAHASHNPLERGVRAAAAQGPTALRRYVQRTEGIYQFSYWDFAKYLPADEQ